jgi:hypothetical protein
MLDMENELKSNSEEKRSSSSSSSSRRQRTNNVQRTGNTMKMRR